MINARDLVVTDIVQPSTIRLLSTAYIDEPAMAPLADDAEDLAFLEMIEGLTSVRQVQIAPLPSGLHEDELLTELHGYGWNYVNAAFCYTRADGNRFNGPERGAWYAAFGDQAQATSHAEVAWHLTRELEATGIFENITSYRELIAGFMGPFHDLRPLPLDADLLSPDKATAYPQGQAIARDVLAQGGNGMIYPSVRHEGGQCLAALRLNLVQNVRQGDTWDFEWSGDPSPEITKRTAAE